MQPRVTLTDAYVRSLQPAPEGQRYQVMDAIVLGFGVRVTEKGAKSWIAYRRWPGNSKPARRTIGDAGKMKLAAARQKARDWLLLAGDGKDPKQEERKRLIEEQRRRRHTFESAAKGWFGSIKAQRKADEVEKNVRREFVGRWAKRPITEITDEEIATFIRDKGKRHPAMARNLLGDIKRLFEWAREQPGRFGLDQSPVALLSAEKLIGGKRKRKRFLADDELRFFWQAAVATPYPYGPLLQLLALTGQRKNEVAKARWAEFDFRKRLWIIPPDRMKMEEAHAVPLVDDVLAILEGLPRFNRGDYLFSTTSGEKPVTGWSKAKVRLDELIEPLGEVKPWVFHDLRRTMRTNLSALKIESHVRERMIAHAQKDTEGTYDLFEYLDEKRDGFELWSARLRSIVEQQGAAGSSEVGEAVR